MRGELPTLKIKDTSGIQDCKKTHINDAGFDVRAAISIDLNPGYPKLIPTGLFLDIPVGYEVQVRPRSGLALKNSITVLNTPGTIDCNYTDECSIILYNHGIHSFYIEKGDRIAQFVLCPVPRYNIEFVNEINKASRGGGFGHSGVK